MSVMQRIKSEITSWCLGLMFGFHIKNHGKSVKCPNTNGCGTVGQCVGLQGVKKKTVANLQGGSSRKAILIYSRLPFCL